jgi:hypothetical protein
MGVERQTAAEDMPLDKVQRHPTAAERLVCVSWGSQNNLLEATFKLNVNPRIGHVTGHPEQDSTNYHSTPHGVWLHPSS